MSNIEQSFKLFLKLPQELRMMVNDEMHPDDRGRFSGASKLCNREAKLSKNYIEFIKFHVFSKDKIRINDRCDKSSEDGFTCFYLEFEKEGDHQYMKYKRLDQWGGIEVDYKLTNVEKELWRVELNNSTTLVEHAVAHFKKLLQTYQKTIKKLEIESIYMGALNCDAEVAGLRNLEELKIEGDFNSIRYISKMKRPLKKLTVKYWNNEFPLEKIYQVYDYLFMPNLKLNNQQFLQLSATSIHLNIGELTAEDVFNFIRSWQNGTVEREMRSIYWDMRGSSFDTQKLFRLLGDSTYPNEEAYSHQLFIKHRKEIGKEAQLVRLRNSLQIRVPNFSGARNICFRAN